MRVLIVGANSILSQAIIHQHTLDEVVILYHTHPSPLAKLNYRISKFRTLTNAFDILYIVSAIISNELERTDDLFDINVKLVKELCEHFYNAKIVYFSTVAVYDGKHNGLINETTLPTPQSIYGITKLWAEKIVQQQKRYSILRIASMYGEGMNGSTFLPKIIEDAISKNEITLLGNGKRQQNYIHVNDVAILAKKSAISKNNEILLAIDSKNYSNKQVAELIGKFCTCDIKFVSEDNSRSVEYQQNIVPFKEYNLTSLENGIKQLINWKRKQF